MPATEKEIAVESVKSTSPDEEKGTRALPDPNWNPGFFKRFPGRGFISLVIVLICLVGEIVVLVTSDGASRTKWPESYQPSVILNLLNSVANIMFGVAIGEAIFLIFTYERSDFSQPRALRLPGGARPQKAPMSRSCITPGNSHQALGVSCNT